ncbi:MAG: hypothetical protein RIR65_1438 [Planctomycetota bacterium]
MAAPGGQPRRVSLATTQVARAEQRMVLEARQLQGLEVLARAPDELYDYLRERAQENPTLVVEAPRGWMRGAHEARARATAGGDEHARWLANVAAPAEGLRERARAQLRLLALADEDLRWGECIVDALDERGWLPGDDDLRALCAAQGLVDQHGALGRAIARIQALEPRGLGARDAKEALLLQLDPRSTDYSLLARLVEECLDDLATGKRAKVARALGIDAELLEELVAHLATLSLDLDDDASTAAAVVTPELEVEPGPAGGFELQLLDGALPAVSIDPGLARLAETRRDDARVRRFLAAQLRESRDLAAALESRRRTLLAVAREVFLRQSRFLVDGPAALVPLSMGEVAEILGVALSTVSRAVAGKHVQTPFGILPLRRFFQAAAGGDATKARESLGTALQALVAGEDPQQPLSDEELVERLRARGYAAARRTVARWREELGIPSSYRRKR